MMRSYAPILIAVFLLAFSLWPEVVNAVDRTKFRTCNDTGFCKRYRNRISPSILAANGESVHQFTVDRSSVRQYSSSRIVALVNGPNVAQPLKLEIDVLLNDVVRVKFREEEPRWQPNDILMQEGLMEGEGSILSVESTLPAALRSLPRDSFVAISINKKKAPDCILAVHLNPVKIELFKGDEKLLVLNDRSLLHYEEKKSHGASASTIISESASIDRHKGKTVVDYGEDGLAIYDDGTKEEKQHGDAHNEPTASPTTHSESFGGHTDTMPNGPMSVGMDISFPFAQHVYGLPEHTSPLSLPTTTAGSPGTSPPHYSQPYRLYNLDVFEYEIDETMALYGHIPFLMGLGQSDSKAVSAGVFWFNPSETFVDISDAIDPSTSKQYKQSHWIAESGAMDIFLFAGSSPMRIFEQLTALTGRQQLPPIFSLGDERDVAAVDAGFEELDFPYDVIWLDIEHTDGKRYFTWDKAVFPNPIEMQRNISNHGRKMVTIIDPHIKVDRNYHIHKEATDKGLYIKEPDGKTDFKGWCWPGESSYLDFTDARVREWWAEQFALDKYHGSSLDLFTWNDMNEPSVFNGPEVSMRKDMKSLSGIEHREWHNLYGFYMQRATAEGQMLRAPKTSATPRPFVLSRAFFAGSQRYGAIWTGDNLAVWEHLKIAAPMLLSINIAGLSFAGADVGGFFRDPDAELFTRWNQAGAFTPFYRGHAHHDSKRREPWVFGEPTASNVRSVAMLRYSLLPYWYTVFYEAYRLGHPVMRPLFVEYPLDEKTYALDDQWMVGSSILVKPVTEQGATHAQVYFPGDQPWYCLTTLRRYAPSMATGGNRMNVEAPLSYIPAYIRGGSVIPRKMRLRRSSKLMFYDPFTLMVALDSNNEAMGYLYMDDETTLDHEQSGVKGSSPSTFALRKFSFSKGVLHNNASSWDHNPTDSSHAVATNAGSGYQAVNTVERVVIVGLMQAPSKVLLKTWGSDAVELSSSFDSSTRVLTIKKPDVKVTETWTITLVNM